MPVLGGFQVFIFLPVIPEMVERMYYDLGIKEGENEEIDNAIADKVNDAYGFVYACSYFVSPLIGAAMQT